MAAATGADVERLFNAGAHFAQAKSRRHPSMKPYLAGAKGRQGIIDLAQTEAQLEAAKGALATLAREGKTALFVGGKTEIAGEVSAIAKRLGAPYVAGRWLGGTISNWPEIKKRVDRLATLAEERASGAASRAGRTKLELVLLEREEKRLAERLGGLVSLAKRPDALVVVDTRHEKHAVKEAKDAGIPIVAIMSSDCNIADAAYPIVANDASRETVRLILGELAAAFEEGRRG
ncbi:MAG: 30S ribosomal protein S2 [Patescibacteria group bacterium]|nr:30S ribosomal protein S2 [Patescibacteria group bacterium]MDE1944432.1 30S ribosomal protein S2 [Patescibacteria group bacterium]MDE1944686.1 30S ribosomal protein S2 [Patescibacteria group bacterium]MDE2057372.1 30S ribosomal protein S2 [Patescibacteria group bacterium]